MILSLLAAVLATLGVVLTLGLSPQRITKDILHYLTPQDSLLQRSRALRGQKQTHRLYHWLLQLQSALEATGKGGQFALICCATLVLFAVGAGAAIVLNNIWLIPALSVSMATIPCLYVMRMLQGYENKVREDLETVLSIVTISYVRSCDILSAVQENLVYIKPPLKATFQAFLGDAMISPDLTWAILNMKNKINDGVFREWCDALILCQADRTLVDTLRPIVNRLSDMRLVNNEMKDELMAVQVEFGTMVAFVVINIPLLYLINQDWYAALMDTGIGKFVLGLCGIIIVVTGLIMFHWTKPVQYEVKEG